MLDSSNHAVSLPSNDVVPIRSIADVSVLVQHPGVVYYSQLSKEPLCDAAAVHNRELLLFQMTIGQKHDSRNQHGASIAK